MIMIVIGIASLIGAFHLDYCRAEGSVRLTKIQTDALYMIMMLSVILIVIGLPFAR